MDCWIRRLSGTARVLPTVSSTPSGSNNLIHCLGASVPGCRIRITRIITSLANSRTSVALMEKTARRVADADQGSPAANTRSGDWAHHRSCLQGSTHGCGALEWRHANTGIPAGLLRQSHHKAHRLPGRRNPPVPSTVWKIAIPSAVAWCRNSPRCGGCCPGSGQAPPQPVSLHRKHGTQACIAPDAAVPTARGPSPTMVSPCGPVACVQVMDLA
mgnify:CR=1 FL=1